MLGGSSDPEWWRTESVATLATGGGSEEDAAYQQFRTVVHDFGSLRETLPEQAQSGQVSTSVVRGVDLDDDVLERAMDRPDTLAEQSVDEHELSWDLWAYTDAVAERDGSIVTFEGELPLEELRVMDFTAFEQGIPRPQ